MLIEGFGGIVEMKYDLETMQAYGSIQPPLPRDT
jgi:hypothetical protein